ncbi:TPA: hypothetical protein N0F65_010496 [Lagenidium giganteum]|uniref:Origin recognition complex subunit 2 n=1 Tax=Lagenidium giganteum TaxID=4803 RepID=A0AAV2Z8N9_9STRA|nr:TPA: hypothetical protein N0F65_010496 [Lagenidium giganteum]
MVSGVKHPLDGDSVASRALLRQRRCTIAPTSFQLGHGGANEYINSRKIRNTRRKTTADGSRSTKKRKIAGKGKGGSAADDAEGKVEDDDDDENACVVEFLPPSAQEIQDGLMEADTRAARRLSMQNKTLMHAVPEQTLHMWRSYLLCGNNLLIYGVGSKKPVLEQFANRHCKDGIVLQLHGYLPKVSIDYVCSFINEKVLQVPSTSKKLVQRCHDIASFTGDRKSSGAGTSIARVPHIFLLVHSLDGEAMRSAEIQSSLSILSTAPFIHVMASIDQINAPALWPESDFVRFRWVYQHINTCAPYEAEFKLQLSSKGKGMDHSSSGIAYILQSLTPSDVSTLKVIAELQLAASVTAPGDANKRKSARSSTADYLEAYDVCRKKMIHKSALTMRNSIRCLEDHDLVRLIRIANIEKLQIPIQEHLIRTIILRKGSESTS